MPQIIESEKVLEARLRKEIERRGGMCLKYTSQYHRGLPDRFVLMPGGFIYFVELKSTGKKPTALQKHAMLKLKDMDFFSTVIDSTVSLIRFLSKVDHDQQTAQITF